MNLFANSKTFLRAYHKLFYSKYSSCPDWIATHLDHYKPNGEITDTNLNHLISQLAKKGRISSVSLIVHSYYDRLNLSEALLISLIANAWCRSKSRDKWRKIIGICLDAKKYDLLSSGLMATYLDACGFYGSLMDLNSAWKYFNDEKSFLICSNHWNSYIQALINLNDANKAFITLKSMPRHLISSKTLVTFQSPISNNPKKYKILVDKSWEWIEENGYFRIQEENQDRFGQIWKDFVARRRY